MIRQQADTWLTLVREQIKHYGVLTLIALLLPGGSVILLGVWLYRRISMLDTPSR
jgi:hypothetical protein